jgi:hypothetical protein
MSPNQRTKTGNADRQKLMNVAASVNKSQEYKAMLKTKLVYAHTRSGSTPYTIFLITYISHFVAADAAAKLLCHL